MCCDQTHIVPASGLIILELRPEHDQVGEIVGGEIGRIQPVENI